MNPNKKYDLIISGIIFIIFIIGAYLLVLNRAMVKGFEHDENQFVASAYLFSTDWLLPYVDYPYFHMPNLIFIYAVLFKFRTPI